ncbi:hypothetical protein PBI_BANDIK_7 [Microbacterium phage Bandik]|uniref:Uncharacterized protein n=4 Tax=Ilzatvirus teagan TaxID=2845595 RepID=A0A2L0HMY2_9CAUD|nr:hypothetical protein H3N90_gp07 [Microbacterium phage Teagan]AUX83031.1 hypothetical protein PBI_LUDGATE_7 [Microbacterium phage Ludgate]AVR56029.1 hypothetical protein PBI_BANDIK_7 [Microbacterium phage Bandik]AVR56336.1 hypothetical protein PBI_NAGEM_7 [Microbacterium phage Nagem]UEM46733.1 hypothetical protein SEA_SJAY_7 [Microbacterium phage SJay]AWN04288.1 hypothetical protein PBI_TEAGAN_7 [Microbacterium phage Teagan]
MSLTQSQWDAQRREAKERAAAEFEASKTAALKRLVDERGEAKAAELAGANAIKAVKAASAVEATEVPEEDSGQAPDDQSE